MKDSILNPKAQKIFEAKYAQTKSNGKKESWPECAWRVAYYVASAEKEYGKTDEEIIEVAKDFYRLIANLMFLPGGRILANAGTNIKNMFNCIVLPVDDSRKGIYKTLSDAAELFAHGSGIGYNFSHLREKGAKVNGTGGSASGPLSFMELFDATGEVIAQSNRRGAQLGVLNCTHPDIEHFINYKSEPNIRNERYLDEVSGNLNQLVKSDHDAQFVEDSMYIVNKILTDNQLTHFNISVGISDKFMHAYLNDETWDLVSPVNDKIIRTISAKYLMRQISESAWRSGDPGVMFLDRLEDGNMTPYLGVLEACNPCAESVLLPYEPCDLGSINLSEMIEDGKISEKKLAWVTTMAIRFLDDIHTINNTPIEEVNLAAKATRRLGLGVLGWADALVKVGLAYDSEEARELAEAVMKTISSVAWGTSEYLATERGSFEAYNKDRVKNIIPWIYEDSLPNLRNVAVTAIAPTGTIALIAGVNSGIEPFYALSYTRYITEGIGNVIKDKIVEVNPHVKEYYENLLADETGAVNQKEVEDAIDSLLSGKNKLPIFKTASEIHWKDHILMQAAFQKYVDNAISKTINMPEDSTIEDVESAYVFAWQQGLKSVALYRDNSKGFQILNK